MDSHTMNSHSRSLVGLAGSLLTMALFLHLAPLGTAADVDYFILGKGQEFVQTNAAGPQLSTDTNGAYRFIALLHASSNGMVLRASVSNSADGIDLESEDEGREFFAQ